MRLGASLRQLCAEGDAEGARKLARRFLDDTSFPLVVRWSSALTAGMDNEAYALLAGLEQPDQTVTLAQFLIYSEFDASRYPTLSSALSREGIDRPEPTASNYACDRTS